MVGWTVTMHPRSCSIKKLYRIVSELATNAYFLLIKKAAQVSRLPFRLETFELGQVCEPIR
jgi:hypothetical protein